MKKQLTYIFLNLCLILFSTNLYSQTTHYLQNGHVIYENNGMLYDLTYGDSSVILKDVMMIKYDSAATDEAIRWIEDYNLLEKRHSCLTGWIVYTIPDTIAILSLADSLLTRNEIEQIQFNYSIPSYAADPPIEPNDPNYLNYQWYLHGKDIYGVDSYGINMPEAWEITTGNPAIRVAVLDNGVDWTNPDIGPDNGLGYDFRSDPPNSNTSWEWGDVFYHGTMISNAIAAKTNNELTWSGIAGGWNSAPVTLVMCKIGGQILNLSAAIIALDWGVREGIRLFNFSWGEYQNEDGECSCHEWIALKDEIDLAYDSYGAIMFSGTGNYNQQNRVAWPACYNKVIGVGGSDKQGERWSEKVSGGGEYGSNYGPNTDISAPGFYIGYPEVPYDFNNPDMKWFASGTSCAVPMAVGTTALMLSINPCLTNVDVEYILEKTARKTGGYVYTNGHSDELGYGLIDAYEAVKMASDTMTIIAVNQNVVFDEPKWFTHDLTLLEGSTLTITSTVKFTEGNKIIVEPGAQLIVDGGTLTSTCPGFWGGIEVRGNADMPQYPVSNQGYVQIINGGRIEQANPGIHSVNGGLVVVTDAVFLNNKRSVAIENYPGWNHSIFTRCSFLLTDASGLTGNQYFFGAEFVHPLRISGCTFKNQISEDSMAYPDRGYGILSLDADIYIYSAPDNPMDNEQDSIRPLFYKLAYGVYSMHSGVQSSMHISDAYFNNNMKGAYLSGFTGSSFALITKSAFEIPNSTYLNVPATYGLYLDHCSGYTIEANEFYSENETSDGYGLIVNESGPYDNEIYNNSFHDLLYGSQAQGCNRYSYPHIGGLCYHCNDFYENANDIFVISDAAPGAPDQGISLSQGNKENAAHNLFTDGSNNGYDIYNPIDLMYYYHDQEDQIHAVKPDPTYGVFSRDVPGSWYNKSEDCPLNGEQIFDFDTLISMMTESKVIVDSLENEFHELLDGGSTEDLVSEVTTSIPTEALEVRDELLLTSPYLSDSVMSAAIAQETVLPNAMIRDILVENPQSAKTDALIEALENRVVPMPDSMMAQIMEGQTITGPIEELEQELGRWKSQYAEAKRNLIQIYDQDTTGISGIDSLISLMNSDSELISRYNLVSLYYSKGMYETGNSVLNAIPSEFFLTAEQEQIHDTYITLFPIIYKVCSDSNGIGSLDSIQISTLADIAANNVSLPGAIAKNLLIKMGILQYDEPILIGSTLKESKKWRPGSDDPSHDQNKDFHLRVFPNPANHYFIVEYLLNKQISTGTQLSVVVTDIVGRELVTYVIQKNYDQVTISTSNLPSSSYVVGLKLNGAFVAQVKISINR